MNLEDITLLIIDDEEQMRRVMSYVIQNSEYSFLQIREASSAEEAMGVLAKENIEIIICDYLLDSMSGIEFFKDISIKYPYTVRILISGNVNYDELRLAILRGDIFRFISKPFDEEEILKVIPDAIKIVNENRLKKELADRLKDF
ncbi:MAG: response regulator [Myxococcota bacterium]